MIPSLERRVRVSALLRPRPGPARIGFRSAGLVRDDADHAGADAAFEQFGVGADVGTRRLTVNAGEARIRGAELDTEIAITDGLSVYAKYSRMDTEYTSFPATAAHI
jgi:outer membrane receptor protein involved in Fe transport